MPKYIKFSPPAPKRSRVSIGKFMGVDFSDSPSNVDIRRSPNAKNMLPDLAGKPVKRTGYFSVGRFDAPINACHMLVLEENGEERVYEFVHAGENLYERGSGEKINTDFTLGNNKSKGMQMNRKLWILDGKNFIYVFTDENGKPAAKKATDDPYEPTVTISRSPSGGGVPYEPVNLLGRGWKETFLGTDNDVVYRLSFEGIIPNSVVVHTLDSNGDRVRNKDFSVNSATGTVTFGKPPGKSPVTGMDNVEICARKNFGDYPDRINMCDIGVLYGVGGAPDRMFVSGHPDYPNTDRFCEHENPFYFGDTSYAVIGSEHCPIVGYSVIGDRLATHKHGEENGRNVYVRTGRLESGQAVFPITTTLQGEGAAGKQCFGLLENEPLFLTESGIFALTAGDISGERYAQNRSFYINGRLTAEIAAERKKLAAAGENPLALGYSAMYKDFYVLALAGGLYLLDGRQRAYEPNAPHSSFQYECYYFDGIDARVVYSRFGKLYFGDGSGGLYEFYTDADDSGSYNDDGRAIDAFWETPDIDGGSFYADKNFDYLALRLAAAPSTGADVSVLDGGRWRELFCEHARTRYFTFSDFAFEKFAFSGDNTPKTVVRRIKLKRKDKVRFRIGNNRLNEPFGIYELAVEYTSAGRYKS